MTESIFVRVQRVISTGASNAIGVVERVTGPSLMRQAIAEIDAVADELRAARDEADTRRVHASLRQGALQNRVATHKEQARFAIAKDREDLARAALAQEMAAEADLAEQRKAEADAKAELKQLDESLAALKLRRTEMERDFRDFEAVRREVERTAPAKAPSARGMRKISRAEDAFERAMAAAGGGSRPSDPAEAAKLAEVDSLRREDEIAARLAALRGEQGEKAAPKPQPRAKPRARA